MGKFRGRYKRETIPGESVELDVGIVLLFNNALEGSVEAEGFRGTILYQFLQFLGFADDIDIIVRTTAKVCKAFTRRKREATRIG